MNNTSLSNPIGYLQIRVSNADGAFPIPGAIVLVSSGHESENGIIASLRTDSSGLTKKIPLSTKSAALSEVPGNDTPYLTYNVEVKKEGFYNSNIMNIPIFENVLATLPVNLVPLSAEESHFGNTFNENREYNYLSNENRLGGGANEQ